MIDSISIYNERQKVFTWYQQSTLSTEELSLSFSNQDLKSLRPIKYFSSIVGVSDSMVNHYKGIEVLTDSIKKQFLASQDVFTHEDLNQVIRFTIDSVYTYSGDIQDQKTPPSAEFDYKVLYSPFVSYGSSNWDQENSIIAIVTPEGISGGALGINSYKNVRQSLALSRGAYLNTIEEVILPNNLISNEEFVQAASIVNYRADNVTWSSYNLALLNSNINSPITQIDSLYLSSFSSLKINFTNQEGTPLDLANIQFYGVVPQSISVENAPILDFTTDTEGGISIASNPFLNPSKTGLSFSNFVIKCTYQGKDYFKWLPYSTLIESYWSNSNSDKDEYKHTFLIDTL